MIVWGKKKKNEIGLVWFVVIYCQSHHSRTAVILFFINSLRDKEVHILPKGITLKVNVIAQIEFKLAFFEAAVKHFSHYTQNEIEKLNFNFW